MQLQGLRLGIKPKTLDLKNNALPTELHQLKKLVYIILYIGVLD